MSAVYKSGTISTINYIVTTLDTMWLPYLLAVVLIAAANANENEKISLKTILRAKRQMCGGSNNYCGGGCNNNCNQQQQQGCGGCQQQQQPIYQQPQGGCQCLSQQSSGCSCGNQQQPYFNNNNNPQFEQQPFFSSTQAPGYGFSSTYPSVVPYQTSPFPYQTSQQGGNNYGFQSTTPFTNGGYLNGPQQQQFPNYDQSGFQNQQGVFTQQPSVIPYQTSPFPYETSQQPFINNGGGNFGTTFAPPFESSTGGYLQNPSNQPYGQQAFFQPTGGNNCGCGGGQQQPYQSNCGCGIGNNYQQPVSYLQPNYQQSACNCQPVIANYMQPTVFQQGGSCNCVQQQMYPNNPAQCQTSCQPICQPSCMAQQQQYVNQQPAMSDCIGGGVGNQCACSPGYAQCGSSICCMRKRFRQQKLDEMSVDDSLKTQVSSTTKAAAPPVEMTSATAPPPPTSSSTTTIESS